MSDRINIEELLIKKLEGLEIEPSGNAWLRTQRMLRRKQFLRFNVRRFNVFYAAGLVVVGIGLTSLLVSDNSLEAKEKGKGKKEKVAIEISQSTEVKTSNSKSTGQGDNGAIEKKRKHNIVVVQEEKVENQQATIPDPEETTNNHQTTTDISDEKEEIVVKEIKTLITYFTTSVTEGCAPLDVEFVNHSENAVSFEWEVEGKRKKEKGKSVVFDMEGEYKVTLIAYAEDGSVGIYSEIITVHPKPIADFMIEEKLVYNYSTDGTEYTWKIKEGNVFSRDFQPDIKEESIQYSKVTRLYLEVSNNYGCIDTLSKLLPKPPKPILQFPSAFSPNPSGPSAGYYNPNGTNNDIFHPRFTEEPIEYNLTIYNRSGELIFQTNNIMVGWDGYYREAPVIRGVYIWKCTGKWKDSNLINLKGDITALWKN